MQDVIIGKYRLSKTENFDAFLAEIGLGYIKRKLAQSTSPEITISRDGDRWTMVTSSALSTSQVSFVLGEDFAEDRQDGVSVTSRVTADENRSNTWTQTQKPGDGKDVTIVREFGDKELKVTSTVNGVTAHRVYSIRNAKVSPLYIISLKGDCSRMMLSDSKHITFSEQCPVTQLRHSFTFGRQALLSVIKMEEVATRIRHSSTSELGLSESRSRALTEMIFKVIAWEKGVTLQHPLLPEIGPYTSTKKRAASPLEKSSEAK
ncbi:Fatty acid-binding protein [Beauveria bassiana D1-5]|uniref:Fatty acid-binding protein n=1 Tax=Beauveria bassiana D1-5 TaxID=1245745 RepID=A0A0A2VFJ0_BEABA|nr:Fatty acid-binding protein [Beauveria bassiana D1-5]